MSMHARHRQEARTRGLMPNDGPPSLFSVSLSCTVNNTYGLVMVMVIFSALVNT